MREALLKAIEELEKKSLVGSVHARQALYPFQHEDVRIELVIQHLNSDNSLNAIIASLATLREIAGVEAPVESAPVIEDVNEDSEEGSEEGSEGEESSSATTPDQQAAADSAAFIAAHPDVPIVNTLTVEEGDAMEAKEAAAEQSVTSSTTTPTE